MPAPAPAPAPTAISLDLAEVWQIDELTAVNISHAVPTGLLDVSQNFDSVTQLNLPTWARNVTQHSLAAAKAVGAKDDWPSRLGDIQGLIASDIDVDLTVQVCTLQDTAGTREMCNITITSTENHNRYLDLRVCLSTFGRFATTLLIRVVVAEDASKAVNVPLSFNVRVGALRVNGITMADPFIGQNLAPGAAASALNGARLPWANGSLINTVVSTTLDFPWAKCSNRSSTMETFARTPYYVGAIKAALTAVLGPGFALSFQAPVTARDGIAFQVSFSACGHLMNVPATVQSSVEHTDDVSKPVIRINRDQVIAAPDSDSLMNGAALEFLVRKMMSFELQRGIVY